MRRIASTTELQSELRRLLAYAQSEQPSRERIAAKLTELSTRVDTGEQHRVATSFDYSEVYETLEGIGDQLDDVTFAVKSAMKDAQSGGDFDANDSRAYASVWSELLGVKSKLQTAIRNMERLDVFNTYP